MRITDQKIKVRVAGSFGEVSQMRQLAQRLQQKIETVGLSQGNYQDRDEYQSILEAQSLLEKLLQNLARLDSFLNSLSIN